MFPNANAIKNKYTGHINRRNSDLIRFLETKTPFHSHCLREIDGFHPK